jgi:hypothetical protein
MKNNLLTLVFLFLFFNSINGQTTESLKEGQSFQIVSSRTYNQVLDVVFPKDAEYSKGILWQLVLRFKPNTKPESQIIIQKLLDGFKVIEYKSENGSIFTRLNKWRNENGKEDIAEMIKDIKVSRIELNIPSNEIKGWYSTFFKVIPDATQKIKYASEEFARTKGAITIFLEGSYYETWFMYGGNEISFVFYDDEINEKQINGKSLLVRWMNKIRLRIQRTK